jgi:hypothetical protein
MAQTRTTCPRCKSPVVVEVEQLFDLNTDPQAKQKILSGTVNMVNCNNCGYQGAMSTPLVYHDPSKELLLTYFPPELGLPVNEQERLIGPLISQVLNRLPPEKRKAYLLRPQTMFTMQTMIETILEKDGITREMLDMQQKRISFLQRLLSTPQATDRALLIQEEESLVDESLFSTLSRLVEVTMGQGDQQGARQLAALQQELLSQTKVGQQLQEQAREYETAIKSLQEASEKGLTRETLLELLINAPSETRLNTLVSLARSGMDYSFFQILADRINAAEAGEKEKLVELREKILKLTVEVDKAIERQRVESRKLLDQILAAPDVTQAAQQAAQAFDELFVEVLQGELQLARQKADLERISRLQKVMAVVEEASAPPPEVQVINDLVSAEDEAARQKILQEHADLVGDEMIDLLNNLVMQSEQQNQPEEMRQHLQEAYRSALRFSMQAKLKQ